ncbi:MAG: RagB/SusD family nutrient uptake outer membrane protein [Mangrovibacterium sp.]
MIRALQPLPEKQVSTGSRGLDKTLDAATTANASTDWIAIRFAEVLLNYGECANQVNKTQEALQVLYDIRKRAGIIPGADNRYGVTAQTKEQIQEAYINENFAEFAFENKRIGDLRRWKRYDIINNQGYRAALFCVLNSDEDVTEFDWTSDIMDADVRAKFHSEVIENVYGATTNRYNMDMNHWFYAVRRTDLERNSKLEQNNEWEGTFNPLE